MENFLGAPSPDRAGRSSARRERERQRRLDLRPLPSVGRRPPEANEQASERTGRRSEAPTKPRQTMPDAVRSRTAGLTESQEPLEATEKDRLQFFFSDHWQNENFPANTHGSDGCHQHLLAMSPIMP